MAILTICLSQQFKFGPGFSEPQLHAAGLFMVDFFNDVIKGSNTFTGCTYFIISKYYSRQVGSKDLLCYLLPERSPITSIALDNGASIQGPGGTTVNAKGKVISEVYMDQVDGQSARSRILANIVIHELMHNKLDTTTVLIDVHNIPGGVVSKKKPLTASDTPSPADVRAMRSGIDLEIPQFTDELKHSKG